MTYFYRMARTKQDEEQIHKLNYKTFVEEIPQHSSNDDRRLMDQFHNENKYLLCMKDSKVIGMIAVRSNRPFSLDKKLGPVEEKLSHPPRYPVEIRLLSIEAQYRTGRPFLGMLQALVNWCLKAGYDAAVISGTVRELKLYRQLGFVPFAEPTGTAEASFVPMILTQETYENGIAGRIAKPMLNFLPGPTEISGDVRKALSADPVSHRSSAHARTLESIQSELKLLTKARHVQVLQGTGTLANDVVAAQLSRLSGKGLILVNGEFGERLCDHGSRLGLEYDSLEVEWGDPFDMRAVEAVLDAEQISWVWFVHCETSTGVLNDLDKIRHLCLERDIRIAVDCASSLGTVPVNLEQIDFASSGSGKGLGSYSGLALVFHKQDIQPDLKIPRYLDLGNYTVAGGIPYTQSSNLLQALEKALHQLTRDPENHFLAIQKRSLRLRSAIERMGYQILAQEPDASPGILTIVLKEDESALHLGEDLFLNGVRTHYESTYLRKRNWLQLAAMNEMSDVEVTRFLQLLERLTSFNREPIRELNIYN
ncbi:aminotransferase class V-fold PLP-dependent enzyme [Sporosarcina gallistercoris]|uniref:Aminotransferase class V-fold PLP-dependent enzyme n=1 Tax=Sporosarcina gallistercoris TaxID=2762245 RepID=A0ABR8PHE1_9BACL|nr:aminotransferase class V-fold PLP-dependent enzyme [Sporosarcina gallistercoris]MBD7907590.1 aminotransferase class V-fold PLP-dependent enzyme [Sporosarcina gallistercoris]